MNHDNAELIAVQALGWLASDDEIWPMFSGATGVSPDDAKTRAGDSAFLASVLEFLTSNDDWVVRFCDQSGHKYEDPLSALYALPGAEQVSWT